MNSDSFFPAHKVYGPSAMWDLPPKPKSERPTTGEGESKILGPVLTPIPLVDNSDPEPKPEHVSNSSLTSQEPGGDQEQPDPCREENQPGCQKGTERFYCPSGNTLIDQFFKGDLGPQDCPVGRTIVEILAGYSPSKDIISEDTVDTPARADKQDWYLERWPPSSSSTI